MQSSTARDWRAVPPQITDSANKTFIDHRVGVQKLTEGICFITKAFLLLLLLRNLLPNEISKDLETGQTVCGCKPPYLPPDFLVCRWWVVSGGWWVGSGWVGGWVGTDSWAVVTGRRRVSQVLLIFLVLK